MKRTEHEAFIEGALFANDHLLSMLELLEKEPPNRFVQAVERMLIDVVNHVGETASKVADMRYPDYEPPTNRDVAGGKRGKLGYD